jgi:peptidoglycan/LPS O-acetylase OafA/YrhL
VAASPAIPLAGMLLVIAARAFGWLPLNDALTRCALFVPLFTAFVMRVHAQTAYADVPAAARGDENYNSFSKALGAKPLTYLGAISFPIYILHGPIGQIFYKRAVAAKLFNGTVFTKYPEFFPVYLGVVLAAAVVTHEGFMKNKKIQTWFQEKGQAIAKAF